MKKGLIDDLDGIEALWLDLTAREPYSRNTVEDLYAFVNNRLPYLTQELRAARKKIQEYRKEKLDHYRWKNAYYRLKGIEPPAE